MAITQVGSATSASISSGDGSLGITKPTGVASGDVLIANVTSDSTVPGAPSGWVQFAGGAHQTASWQNNLYYKVAGGSEPSSYTWTVGTVGPGAGIISAWRGVNTSPDPIDAVAETDDDTLGEPNTGPDVTATVGSGRLLYFRHVRDGGGGGQESNFTESTAGVTRLANEGGTSGTGSTAYTCSQFADDADFSGAGVKNGLSITSSITEDENFEATVALQGVSAISPSGGTATPSTTTNKPTPAVKTMPTVIG